MADGLLPRTRPVQLLGGLSAALLAVSLGGALLGVADGSGGAAAHPASVAVAAVGSAARSAVGAAGPASGSASDAVHGGGVPAAHPATHGALERSTPIQLALPSIGLTAPLLGLGTDGRGLPELPPFSQPRTAGWLRDSAIPGAAGTAVLVGHVDTRTGPAVFWGLSTVKPGAPVEVGRLDGSTALFDVDEVRYFDRAVFPVARVYAPAADAQLRIVTCGGVYDRTRREYSGNVVVFAHLSGVRPAPA